jgi:ATP/maltotriose-dependent transcriptional regulator MalT
MMKSIAHASIGEADEAQAYQCRAVDLATVTRQPYDVIAANYGRGFYQLRWGDLNEACATLEETLNLARRYEVRHFIPIVACQLAKSHLIKGDAAQAQQILLGAKLEAEALGHTFGVLRASTYLALALQQLGDIRGSLAVSRAANLTAEQQGFESLRAEALFAQASALAFNIDTAKSKECLASVISIATKIDARPQLAAAKALLSTILAREGDTTSSERELAEAENVFAEVRMTRPSRPISVCLMI